MKKTILFLLLLLSTTIQAQDYRTLPQLTINGEGKVKVIPDQASITVAVENKGFQAKEVKKTTDMKITGVIRFIKAMGIATTDFKTQSVALNPQYDYEKKRYIYFATQTIEIILKDLTQYDELIEGLVNEGVNRIDNVTFRSSKMASYQSEARKLAMKDAKLKAEDYVSVLGQKIGKAVIINDNSEIYRPQPMFAAVRMDAIAEKQDARETLAVGEINCTANVTVSFLID